MRWWKDYIGYTNFSKLFNILTWLRSLKENNSLKCVYIMVDIKIKISETDVVGQNTTIKR